MKKRIKYLFIMLFNFSIFSNIVYAADFSISLTSSSVTVGNSVTLKIDGTSSELTGRFNISSSDNSVIGLSSSYIWIEKNTGSITIEAKKAGSATITVTPTDGISDGEANEVKLGVRTITITVNDVQAPPTPSNNQNNNNNNYQANNKSSNNYLTSITIDGIKLNEDFDREVLEYTATAPVDTEKVKINAQLADSSAKITGTGEVNVTTGINNFELIVTAANGSKRTYKLSVTVLEDKPIITKINNEEYTVIRKRKDLPKISEYNIEKDITINNEVVAGYYNEKLGYDLVALKDKNGKINYYIYKASKYTLYNELNIGATTLQVLDKDVAGYKKTSFTYDNNKIPSYQEVKLDILKNTYALDNNDISGNQFYLFYAKNLETGKENLYQYDALEKTVQRYNLEVLNMYKDNLDTYYVYLLIILILSVILIIIIFIMLLSNTKKRKVIKERIKRVSEIEDE